MYYTVYKHNQNHLNPPNSRHVPIVTLLALASSSTSCCAMLASKFPKAQEPSGKATLQATAPVEVTKSMSLALLRVTCKACLDEKRDGGGSLFSNWTLETAESSFSRSRFTLVDPSCPEPSPKTK